MLYAWQTTRIPSPWIFTDELNWALLSRGIAHTAIRSSESTPCCAGLALRVLPSAGVVGRRDGAGLRGVRST